MRMLLREGPRFRTVLPKVFLVLESMPRALISALSFLVTVAGAAAAPSHSADLIIPGQAPGPVKLPDWTPKVPQFKADGPAVKKIVDDEVDILQTGTSPLTPAELGDSWEAAKGDKLNSSRSNNSINDTKTVFIYLYTRGEPQEKVVLEATRAPEEKITHVKISSPLPKPKVEEED